MKKISECLIIIIVFVSLMMFLPSHVEANIVCNDGTVSPNCSDCHRGCCSKHGGCSSSSSSSNGSTKNNSNSSSSNKSSSKSSKSIIEKPIIKEVIKSDDVSLKEVTVNFENIKISDDMSYTTTKESVKVYVVANDTKATTQYENNLELSLGDNIIDIKVTAENGEEQDYTIIVEKSEKTEKGIIDIIATIIMIQIFCGIGYLIYFIIKLITKKSKHNAGN